MAYASRNLGRSWEPLSVIANGKLLVLCEASVIRLPGRGPKGEPRLLALMPTMLAQTYVAAETIAAVM